MLVGVSELSLTLLSPLSLSSLLSRSPLSSLALHSPLSCSVSACQPWAACILVAKMHDCDPEGLWFKLQSGHNQINAAVGPSSKAP